MVLNKTIIDVALAARDASENAQKEAFLKSIEERMDDLKKLPECIHDVMDTYRYVRRNGDESLAKAVWREMCTEDGRFGLSFCNAIRTSGDIFDRCGVRPDHRSYGNICITEASVLTREGEFTMDEVRSYLSDKPASHYESLLKSVMLLIDAVPKYRDAVASRVESIFQSLKTR